jgi:MYXO-CTERM domain-containing protein
MMRKIMSCSLPALFLVLAGGARAGVLGPRLEALVHGRLQALPAFSKAAVRDPLAPRADRVGRVQVVIRPALAAGALPPVGELASLGAVRIRVSPLMHLAQAWVPVGSLESLAALPGVGRVSVPVYATVRPPYVPHRAGAVPQQSSSSVPSGLPIDATGLVALQGDLLQSVGAEGQGIKVGVISDDDSGDAASQQAGYLPTNIFQDPTFLSTETQPTPGDPAEGTALLEVVHAVAPQAQLGFCGPQTDLDFVTCYQDFIKWGANVVLDDLGFPGTDMFTRGVNTSGSFANAVYQIVSGNPDVAFLSAAGNDSQDYLQAPYASTTCPSSVTGASGCMDFGGVTSAFGANLSAYSVTNELPVILFPGYTFVPILEWNDPPSTTTAPTTQYELYLLDGSGNVLASGGTFSVSNDTTGDGRPASYFFYTVPSSSASFVTDNLVIACTAGCTASPVPSLKLIGDGDGAVLFGTVSNNTLTPMYTIGSTSDGETAVPGVLATAAAEVDSENPLAVTLEGYSALGPFLYGNAGATGEEAEPAITGIDGIETSGAGGFSGLFLPNGGVAFCGTSATAPNVGALVADLMSAKPGQTASFYAGALESTASSSLITGNPIPANNPTGFQCSFGNPLGYSADSAGPGLAQGYAALTSPQGLDYQFPTISVTVPAGGGTPETTLTNGESVTDYGFDVGKPVTLTAAVTGGTTPAKASSCEWTYNGQTVTGSSASITFTTTAVQPELITVNCPDENGIMNPEPATIEAVVFPTPVSPSSSSSSGGGGLSPLGLLLLALLAAAAVVRRRRTA